MLQVLELVKSEIDRKPTSYLDRKPASYKEYPLKNTQGVSVGISNQQTLRFEDVNIRRGFAQVPNVVLRDPALSGNEKTLYALLLSYAWQMGECWPGQETLAADMGLTVRSISSLLRGLRRKRLISWRRQGLGKVNIYLIKRLGTAYPQMMD